MVTSLFPIIVVIYYCCFLFQKNDPKFPNLLIDTSFELTENVFKEKKSKNK